jgi:DNA-binding HxlR family transcriptional regulator
MKRTSFAGMNCSIARTLEVIGEWWSLLILRDAFLGIRRFDDFQRSLGIARNILTDRLATLVDHGILTRECYQEHPARYEYRLTAKGADLVPVLVSLLRWGDRWTAGEAGPPLVLEHESCGRQVMPILVCPACREDLGPQSLRPRPGPGARKDPPAPESSISTSPPSSSSLPATRYR